MNNAELLQAVTESGLVVVIRCPIAGVAEQIGRCLIEQGVTVLEVTLTTPDALEAIAALAAHAPDGVLVGAGTVLTAADVDAAIAAGARFTVTPSLCEAVEASVARGVPVLAGALTPSEVYQAHLIGAAAVKVFPISSVGAGHLKAIRDPLPQIPLLAVGGVGLDDIAGCRAAGAIGVGVGGPLLGDSVRGGSLDELAQRTEQFVAMCHQ